MTDSNGLLVPSATYKLKIDPTKSDSAIYFTICGETIPRWLFINSKEMKSYQWITALMTSYSRLLKVGVPVTRIIEDMKETFDPGGKYTIPDGSGQEVNSIVHHLGLVLEKHMENQK